MQTFELQYTDPNGDDFIELNKLLKVLRLVENGGMANAFITQGMVKVNGNVDTRKRAKIRRGDRIEVEGQIISII